MQKTPTRPECRSAQYGRRRRAASIVFITLAMSVHNSAGGDPPVAPAEMPVRVAISDSLAEHAPDAGTVTVSPASDPVRWPDLAAFDVFVLASGDWSRYSRRADEVAGLQTWIGFGGALVIVVDSSAQRDAAGAWAQTVRDAARDPGVFAASDPVRVIARSELGAFLGDGLAAASPNVLRRAAVTARLPDRLAAGPSGSADKRGAFPARDSFGERPPPTFFIVMVVAAALFFAGPVSVRLCAPPGRRWPLLVTTPVVAVAAAAMIYLVLALNDGRAVEGRRFTVLDLAPTESGRPSLVYQEQFIRAGMVAPLPLGLPVDSAALVHAPDQPAPALVRHNSGAPPTLARRSDLAVTVAAPATPRGGWEKVGTRGDAPDLLALEAHFPTDQLEAAWFADGTGLIWRWDGEPADELEQLTFRAAGRDPDLLLPLFEGASAPLKAAVRTQLRQPNQRPRVWARLSGSSVGALDLDPAIDWLASSLVITSPVLPAGD